MPRRKPGTTPLTPVQALAARLDQLERQVARLSGAGPVTVQRGDSYRYSDPVQGEIMIHSKSLTEQEYIDEYQNNILRRRHQMKTYHDGRWRAFGDFVIKLFEDNEVVTNKQFSWRVPEDLDSTVIQRVEAGVIQSPSGGNITVDVRINGGSIFISPQLCTIDIGDVHSSQSVVIANIDKTVNEVFHTDLITIVVSFSGSQATGLAVVLGFA